MVVNVLYAYCANGKSHVELFLQYFRMVNKKTRICVVERALFNERNGVVGGGNYKKQINMNDSL